MSLQSSLLVQAVLISSLVVNLDQKKLFIVPLSKFYDFQSIWGVAKGISNDYLLTAQQAPESLSQPRPF